MRHKKFTAAEEKRLIQDKSAREAERLQLDEERDQLQTEIMRLTDALAHEKKRGSGRGCFAAVQSVMMRC